MKRAALAAVLVVTAAAAGYAAYRHNDGAPTQTVIRPWAIHEACVAKAARHRPEIRRQLLGVQRKVRAQLRVETRPSLRRSYRRTLRDLARTGPTSPGEYGFIDRCENGPWVGFPVSSP